ncbi:MAG: TolB family protein [Thermoanaerobaculia bacterium]
MLKLPGFFSLTLLALAAPGLAAGPFELISRVKTPPDSFGESGLLPSLSADGRYVAFISKSPNLVPGQSETDNQSWDTFLHDRVTGTTTLISHTSGSPSATSSVGNNAGAGNTAEARISADGRYVVFAASGSDVVPGVTDRNFRTDVFLWDRVTGAATLISHAAGQPNVTGNETSSLALISADGNFVVFNSQATDLVSGHPQPGSVYLWQRRSRTLTRITRDDSSPNHGSFPTGISSDGGFVLFEGNTTSLVPGATDANGEADVFLYQRATGAVTLVSRADGSPLRTANGFSGESTLSADGRWVAFISSGKDLIPGQTGNALKDVYLFDRVTGQMRLVSHAADSPQTGVGGANSFGGPALSADGRYLVFVSEATNLVPGQVDTNFRPEVLLYDRVTGAISLVSHTPGSDVTAPSSDTSGSGSPSLSADGRFVAFSSGAAQLVSGQFDTPGLNVFLYDRTTRAVTLVSHADGSLTTGAGGVFNVPVISADGGVVAFDSTSSSLVEGHDLSGFRDLFAWRRSSSEITVLTSSDPSVPALSPNGPSSLGDMSADGRFVVFVSRTRGLVEGQITVPWTAVLYPDLNVYLRDRTAGRTILLSRSPDSPVTAVGGSSPVISADGRFTALIMLGPGGTTQLALYDRNADALVAAANHVPGSPGQISGIPERPAISADGRFVAYECHLCSLVPGQQDNHPDQPNVTDVYLYDRETDTNVLVSHAAGSLAGTGDFYSRAPLISADGRFVAFYSQASNLIPGVNSGEIYLFDRTANGLALVSHSAASPAVGAGGGINSSISADGRWILYRSGGTDLVPGQIDTEFTADLFLYDRLTGTNTLVSHASGSPVTAGNRDVDGPSTFAEGLASMSADGRWIVYLSNATNLAAGVTDANGLPDVFLYDRLSGVNTLISSAAGTPQTTPNNWAADPRISADGSRIAFLSPATNLLPGQAINPRSLNLIVQNRATGARTLVSRVRDVVNNTLLEYMSLFPRLSTDGRWVGLTTASPLVSGDFNADWDVYAFDATAPPPGSPVPVRPCNFLDARLRSNIQRIVPATGRCGVPAVAAKVVVKVTVRQPTGKGNLRFFPGNAPATSSPSGILRFNAGQTVSSTFTLTLANGADTFIVLPFVERKGTVQVTVAVTGYVP